jgi:hypothetical protein
MEQNRDGGFLVTKEESVKIQEAAQRVSDRMLVAMAPAFGGTYDPKTRKLTRDDGKRGG